MCPCGPEAFERQRAGQWLRRRLRTGPSLRGSLNSFCLNGEFPAAAGRGGRGRPSVSSPPSAAPPVAVAEFVSEADVLAAISRREKIWIGPGTIVTPSAREIGAEKEVFIETDQMPAGRFRTSGAASSREG